MPGQREYGDYQTPIAFAERVCQFLQNERHLRPSAVVEPTCGLGNFLKSSLLFQADAYYGIEINPAYCAVCRSEIQDARVQIIQADFFQFSFRQLAQRQGQTLIIGNPPWVTSASLSAMGSANIPEKSNFKGLRGIDAITGASNFDISEYMIMHLIQEYANTDTVIAVLCKTSVARRVFQELKRSHTSFLSCELFSFDAHAVFQVYTSACLLVITLSETPSSPDFCTVSTLSHPDTILDRFGYLNGQLYSHLDAQAPDFYGTSCLEWRQGVKHDCAKVMELQIQDGRLQNGLGETVDIEDKLVYPLIKSSMFKSPVIHTFSKYVLVTQKKVREDTAHLAEEVPKTWQYLQEHRSCLDSRKSAIYRKAPAFSMFGVGPYSYARYKVGVSGFYKKPLFSLLYADDGRPVMTDDTSYCICLDRYDEAYVAMLLLNTHPVQDFLQRIACQDAKRPYTKKLLSQLDFGKITGAISLTELQKTEQALALSPHVTQSAYEDFQALLHLRT